MTEYMRILILVIGRWQDIDAHQKMAKAIEDAKAFHDTIIEYRC